MKKLLIVFLLLSSLSVAFAANYEEPAGGAQEGSDVGFGNMTATSLKVGSGTAAAPSIGLGAGGDTGLYEPTANSLGFSVGGSGKWKISANGILLTLSGAGASILNTGGSSTAPIYRSAQDTNTGISGISDELFLIAGGVPTGKVTTTGVELSGKTELNSLAVAFNHYSSGDSPVTVDDAMMSINCDAGAGSVTFNLMSSANVIGTGYEITITDATSGKCYIDPAGSENLNGFAIYSGLDTAGESVLIRATSGSTWDWTTKGGW